MVHVQVHIPQKLEVQVEEVQMHLYQMVRQVILLLLVQLKDLLVVMVQAQVEVILVVEQVEQQKLEFLFQAQLLTTVVEEVQEQQLVFQLLLQLTQVAVEDLEQVVKVQLLHVELEEKVVLRQRQLLLQTLALLIEVVEVEVGILLLPH